MDKLRKGIEESHNLIKNLMFYNKTHSLGLTSFDIQINQLLNIANENLDSNDELIRDIQNTKQIIDNGEMK